MDNQNNSSSQGVDDQLFSNGLSYKDIIEKDVLDLMGFTTLTQEKKDELHQKIYQAIEERAAARLYDMMPEQDRDEYQKLLDEKKYKEMGEFLKARKIDLRKILSEETVIMKLELYEDSRFVRGKLEEVIKNKAKQE